MIWSNALITGQRCTCSRWKKSYKTLSAESVQHDSGIRFRIYWYVNINSERADFPPSICSIFLTRSSFRRTLHQVLSSPLLFSHLSINSSSLRVRVPTSTYAIHWPYVSSRITRFEIEFRMRPHWSIRWAAHKQYNDLSILDFNWFDLIWFDLIWFDLIWF